MLETQISLSKIYFDFSIFQLKYKRRVYKMLQMDEKQLKSINSKANHKKFLENVASNNVDKVNKMCVKGLDPNFHCENSGGKYVFITFFVCKKWCSYLSVYVVLSILCEALMVLMTKVWNTFWILWYLLNIMNEPKICWCVQFISLTCSDKYHKT